jgi:hypothetical protein
LSTREQKEAQCVLQRFYADTLEEPLPGDLATLLDRLDHRDGMDD